MQICNRCGFLSPGKLVWMLYGVLFLVSSNTLASDQTGHNEEDDNRPPVEAGAGGTIKLESDYRTEAESLYQWHAHLLWESRYVREGRDLLSADDIVSMSSELIIDDVTFIPWIAHSADSDYTELNLNFVYSTYLTRKLVASLGYNHLRFRYQGMEAYDNEIGIDLGYQLFRYMTVSALMYYSFEADGSFIQIGPRHGGTISNKVHYSLQALLGANKGYIADGHHGLDHFQLRAGLSWFPATQLELYAYTAYNQAIDRDATQYPGDELLDDFAWGGAGMVYLF